MRQVQHFRSSSVDITVCRPAAAGLRGSDTTPCNPLPLPHREEWNLQVGDELLLAPPVRKYPSIEFGAKQCRASAQMICPSSLRGMKVPRRSNLSLLHSAQVQTKSENWSFIHY